jgi:MOSC domain-containing protein YiiM
MLAAMDGITPETCDECGFDAGRWKVRDAATLLAETGWWWRAALDGIDRADLNRRPAPEVWSALEYGAHTALVLAMVRTGIELIMATDGLALPAIPEGTDASVDDAAADLDPAAVVRDLEREGRALAELSRTADKATWAHTGVLPDGERIQAEALFVHAAHDASHHQMDVGRGLAALGVGAPAQAGTVARVNASDGGVPKHSIGGADVTFSGLDGDRQAERKHHGRPFQALCLWSTEVLAELAADGHPIEAGSAGENVTVAGLDWSTLRPGAVVRVGGATAEISFPATPCKKQTRWFADGDFRRIDYDRNPQWVRWYAWVREPGRVAEGDAVVVRP